MQSEDRDAPSQPSRSDPDLLRAEPSGRVGVLIGLLVITAALGFALATRLLGGGEDAVAPAPPPPVRTLQVSAAAADGGDGSEQRPFVTIQPALEAAGPGDVIAVGPGTYEGEVRTVRAGRPEAPIQLRGSGARIVGEGTADLVRIDHDDIVLSGFEIAEDTERLIWVQGAQRVRILDNFLHDAEGECVRIKYQASEVEVARNRIVDCGAGNFNLAKDDKNGEGVYIGTAPEQLDENPTSELDTSARNWVHDNQITVPAECVDVKEHAEGNIIERNTCTGGLDDNGAGISSRGIGTVIRDNRVVGNTGSGIRMGGDESTDGIRSIVRDNEVLNNAGFGVEVNAVPQELVCGNVVRGSGRGVTSEQGSDPQVPCPA